MTDYKQKDPLNEYRKTRDFYYMCIGVVLAVSYFAICYWGFIKVFAE
jgi:hypothetical protein